ncbi:DUF2911 domain-containing protein [Maribacter polysaccharolyticus]|uniref:DUF2911 domain-containing protein n=1 Tax=Maribacter polysaccharolyticus TaxID=3020831 RepID=UPI00237F9301|nr:DUF2911 domain-containing protein [Maribacter polysaccharolyticus]MDE3741913.1 DUF2911 domain-containing protein [Maribacter polysaccharolyticus]
MKKIKWIILSLVALVALFIFVGMPYLKKQTKKISPEVTKNYNQNGFDLSINYSAPFKKDRVIFGELVPYDRVWRTGANEPTIFATANAIKIIDKPLPAGSYSFWTVPGETSWKVIFNSEIPDWGVTILSGGKETTRNPEADVITVEVPSGQIASVQEQLTLNFEDDGQLYLVLSWDHTKIKVPLNKK